MASYIYHWLPMLSLAKLLGNFAYPYLWKENKADTEYKEAWSDPRISKVEKNHKEQDKYLNISKNLKKSMRKKR